MPGPPPTPTKVLQLRGSWRGNARGDEPQPSDDAPEPPEWLDAGARKIWSRLLPLLEGMKLASRTDEGLIARYCQTFSLYVTAQADLALVEKLKKKKKVTNREWRTIELAESRIDIAFKASDRLDKMGAQLGLTPAARASLAGKVPAPQPKAGEKDKNRFFKRGTG